GPRRAARAGHRVTAAGAAAPFAGSGAQPAGRIPAWQPRCHPGRQHAGLDTVRRRGNEPLSSPYRQDLNWLVTDFTTRVADVAHAIVVSADGVPLALSEHIPAGFGGQLAAITSGLTSLMQGAARLFEAGLPTQALVEMEAGLMLV